MYVTPRPDARDDPLFAVRIALIGMLSYAAIPVVNPALPALIAAFPLSMIAGQRKAYSPAMAVAGPLALIVMVFVITWVVEQLLPMPIVFLFVMWLLYFFGFREILRTGTPVGMLVIIVTLMMSVMGMDGTATVEVMRDDLALAAVVALVLSPIVYLIVPVRTREVQVATPVPSSGKINTGAAIRATVLLILSFWLYSVMSTSDLTMALIAAMVIVFPTRGMVWGEAGQRILATLMGAVAAFLVLSVFLISSHLPTLLGLIFLVGLWAGNAMLNGPRPSMVYQYAFSVALSLIAGALSTQDPAYASYTRIVLTLSGSFVAAFAVALLDALTDWRGEQTPKLG